MKNDKFNFNLKNINEKMHNLYIYYFIAITLGVQKVLQI